MPPADPATLAELLRIQAEGEFSSELKDLVYDYAADATAGHPTSVLLIATPQRYVDAAVALCDAAKLSAAAVTPSAVALGAATAGRTGGGDADRHGRRPRRGRADQPGGAAPSAIRYLRGPAAGGDYKPFLGELRRTVSTLPTVGLPGDRQIVLWGTPADAAAVGDGLGIRVSAGDLPTLGVSAERHGRQRRRPAVRRGRVAGPVGRGRRAGGRSTSCTRGWRPPRPGGCRCGPSGRPSACWPWSSGRSSPTTRCSRTRTPWRT